MTLVSLQLKQYGQTDQKNAGAGLFDFRYDREDDLIVSAWNDNSVVTLASNSDTVEPLTNCSKVVC